MKRKIGITLILAGIALIVLYTFINRRMSADQNIATDTIPEEIHYGYIKMIEDEREEKDIYMKTAEDSPLADSTKASFTHLSYYPVDSTYRILADLIPAIDNEIVTMRVRDAKSREYIKYGVAEFELAGAQHQLTLFKYSDPEYDKLIFLPFFDKTSGEETYGGGRYLEILQTDSLKVEIDFNKAYNPYCSYNLKYHCTIPPDENRLSVPILAGEKNVDFSH